MTLRPNRFAADQEFEAFSTHCFRGDAHTIKNRLHTDLPKDVYMGINCCVPCNSK